VRSTKAGAGTPATRRVRPQYGTLAGGRSTKAGAGTPATHAAAPAAASDPITLNEGPLNEGRGGNPGDTAILPHGRQ
jgi:hypothetical protein